MASSSLTRLETVTTALALAGRDVGIRSLAESLLNMVLKHMALEYKYPVLRKVGDVQTLASGSSTTDLPSDWGAGGDNLLFGDDRLPIWELSMDDFVAAGGFPGTNVSTGRPSRYIADQNANQFRFNSTADQNYSFIPVYYSCPAAIPSGDIAYDSQKLWMPNDDINVQGLVWKIFQYTGDVREAQQFQLWERLKAQYRQGSVPLGGGSNRVGLSRQTFKTRKL
jgi:hypothetical protein